MFLEGTFCEYPFSWLLEILLHKRETGLLEVSTPEQSGYFYIKNGEIKDGELGKLRGVAAFELAGTLEDASFQFRRLDPSDYARVVWEKSFGPSNVTVGTRVLEAFRTALKKSLSYPVLAYGILEKAVAWLAGWGLLQLLLSARTTYHSFKHAGVFIAHRTFANARTAYVDLSRRAKSSRKLVPALRPALAEWQTARRRSKEIIIKKARSLNFQRGFGPIRERTAVLSSPQPFALSRAMQAARFYVSAAGRNLENAGIWIARRTRAYATTVTELTKKIQVRRKLVAAFRIAQAEWRIALRRPTRLISKTAGALNLQMALALIRARLATFPSFEPSALARTIQQVPFHSAASLNSENARISIARQARAYATAALGFARGVPIRRELVPTLRLVLAVEWQIGLRRTKQIILKTARTLSFQKALALIQERRAQSNISFAVIIVMLLVGTTVSISKMLSTNNQPNDAFKTKEENIRAQSEAQPRVPSAQRRAKRKPLIGRTRTRKQATTKIGKDPAVLVAK